MAELNKSEIYEFTAAASALALITGHKLARNFRYYRSSEPDIIRRDNLISLCISIRKDAFSLHNMMCSADKKPSFFVALAGRISDRLEELHRKLLFFEPGSITDAIEIIDRQRTFWKRCDDELFYENGLIDRLENDVPEAMLKIEVLLKQLPRYVIL
ncbi:hypothetical protein [Rhodohalobacter mucosus]|uniref:Uncharacterized protein n=1 Tax=Rhodohalobacter mucosus TaxID=2079485 RepID=A0A316TQI8_9BACT|nr:hypothetical protein [Rhodohalobacter mucosus]PWN05275.1 hypothetical protein DDZ15_14450 [Rhodohalobacter mucosus]